MKLRAWNVAKRLHMSKTTRNPKLARGRHVIEKTQLANRFMREQGRRGRSRRNFLTFRRAPQKKIPNRSSPSGIAASRSQNTKKKNRASPNFGPACKEWGRFEFASLSGDCSWRRLRCDPPSAHPPKDPLRPAPHSPLHSPAPLPQPPRPPPPRLKPRPRPRAVPRRRPTTRTSGGRGAGGPDDDDDDGADVGRCVRMTTVMVMMRPTVRMMMMTMTVVMKEMRNNDDDGRGR